MNKYSINDFFTMLDDYQTCKITRDEFYSLQLEYPDVYRKRCSDIRKAEELRSKVYQDRKLEVMYLVGDSGAGKTTLAKHIAKNFGFDLFISGTGDDIFDGYDKQRCIFLDDFRGSTMKFNELLKLLDNHTNSSISSRYHNKDISMCKLIIISSVIMPNELYSCMRDENEPQEPVEQFYRRLKHRFFSIKTDEYKNPIREYALNKSGIYPTGNIMGYMKDVFKAEGIDPEKCDEDSILDQLLTKEETKSREDIIF